MIDVPTWRANGDWFQVGLEWPLEQAHAVRLVGSRAGVIGPSTSGAPAPASRAH